MRGDTTEVAEEAASAVAAGFQTLYLKIGMSIEDDIALIEAIRAAAGPSAAIRVDPNEGWSFATTRSMLDRLRPLNIELLEQPTLAWNHEELARLRSTRTGILANESSWQERDVVQCLKTAAADVISLDQQMLGSLTLLKKTAGMCEAWGVPVLKHSFGELGIATAAALHVLSTCPNATLANQSYCSVLESDVIVGDSLACTDGFLTVPDGPGLRRRARPRPARKLRRSLSARRRVTVGRTDDGRRPLDPALLSAPEARAYHEIDDSVGYPKQSYNRFPSSRRKKKRCKC